MTQNRGKREEKFASAAGNSSAPVPAQMSSFMSSGLIRREVSASDRRNLDILLTPEGEQAAVEARQERERMADELFGILTGEEKEQLYPLLEKLADAWAADEAKQGEGIK